MSPLAQPSIIEQGGVRFFQIEMNIKKLLLVFLVLVGSAQKASAESFDDCVFDAVKSRAVGVAASLALGAVGFTPVELEAVWLHCGRPA